MNNPLLSLFFGSAVASMVAPESQPRLVDCLAQAHAVTQSADFVNAVRADTGDFWAFDPNSYMASLRPYVVVGGILQIPVKGVLLNDFPYAVGSYATGYLYIAKAFERGMGDPDVKGIALVVESCGGQVAGCFELGEKMYAQKGVKPIRAFVGENGFSAAYLILSVADKACVARTGCVGSIGVVTGHMDVSKAMDIEGYKFTYISAPEGGHKTDGNPYEALPDDVRARIQARINVPYDVFVSTVARNRGMEEQAVRDTKADCFTAQEAVSLGLADTIGSLDDSLADYAADLCSDEGDVTMSTKDTGTVDQAAHETALAAARAEGLAAGKAEATTEATAVAATAERTRIAAIRSSDEAKDRPAAAESVALNTDMSVDAAKAFLATLPKEAVAAAPKTEAKPHEQKGFDGAMKATPNPQLGAGAGEDAEAEKGTAGYAISVARAFGVAGLRPAQKAIN